jgi:hypothetical protein
VGVTEASGASGIATLPTARIALASPPSCAPAVASGPLTPGAWRRAEDATVLPVDLKPAQVLEFLLAGAQERAGPVKPRQRDGFGRTAVFGLACGSVAVADVLDALSKAPGGGTSARLLSRH